VWIAAVPVHAWAAEGASIDQRNLRLLAHQFVDKVGGRYAEAEQLVQGIPPEELRTQAYFDAIPDEEPLLLNIYLGKAGKIPAPFFEIDSPITSIKRGKDVMLSLRDFMGAAEFPIEIDADSRTAQGWFIREDNPFKLNAADKTMQSGKTVIAPA
jgi:hypothetical protein